VEANKSQIIVSNKMLSHRYCSVVLALNLINIKRMYITNEKTNDKVTYFTLKQRVLAKIAN